MDKYNMEDLRTVEAQIASLVKTRDKILAGMADENKKLTNDSSQVVCDGMKDFTCVKKLEVDKPTGNVQVLWKEDPEYQCTGFRRCDRDGEERQGRLWCTSNREFFSRICKWNL